MHLTEKEALELSRQLWDRLAKLPDADLSGQHVYDVERSAKKQCITAMGYDPAKIQYHCFACEYASQNGEGVIDVDCRECPVPTWRDAAGEDFDEDEDDRPCLKAEFGAFLDADTTDERRALAIVIRDLMEPPK
jgi:hypothetical protein